MTYLEEHFPGIAEELFQYREILSAINQAITPYAEFLASENAERVIEDIVKRTVVR